MQAFTGVTAGGNRLSHNAMIEIRIHGRGGQGGVTLAKLIATSRFLQGLSVQAFGLTPMPSITPLMTSGWKASVQ